MARTVPTAREFLTRKEASEYLTEKWLKVSVSLLAKYAVTGGGPPYRPRGENGGEAMYTRKDLDTWAQSFLNKPYAVSKKDRAA